MTTPPLDSSDVLDEPFVLLTLLLIRLTADIPVASPLPLLPPPSILAPPIPLEQINVLSPLVSPVAVVTVNAFFTDLLTLGLGSS